MFKRSISSVVIFVFTITQVLLPQPYAYAQAPRAIEPPSLSISGLGLRIPSQIGEVNELFVPPQADRREDFLIAYIQTAHANTEAQRNIEKILDNLTQSFGKTLIALEGAKGALRPENLQVFSEKKLNDELINNLAQKGQLTGAELFALREPEKVVFRGVEDIELYRENIESYRRVYALKEYSLEWLSAINGDLRKLKSRVFSKELMEFDKTREAYHREAVSTYDYLVYLSKWAFQKAIIDLNHPMEQKDFPILTRVLALKRAASQMRDYRKQLQGEIRSLKQDLQERGIDPAYLAPLDNLPESLPQGGSRSYFESLFLKSLASDRPIEWKKYPAFTTFTEYSILQEEIDGVRFFSEIRKLESVILSNIDLGKREKILLDLSQDVVILERLFSLQASREEVAYFKARKDYLEPSALENRIKDISKQFARFKTRFEKADIERKKVNEAFRDSEAFYNFAEKRDLALLENTLTALRENDLKRAVLITGGYHSQGVRRLLRDRKIPYVLISPRIETEFTTEKYERLLMEDLFEKVQARSQYSAQGGSASGGQKVELALMLQKPEFFRQLDPDRALQPATEVTQAALETLGRILEKTN